MANARRWSRPARACSSTTRTSTPRRSCGRADILADPASARGDAAPPHGPSAARAPRTRSRSSCSRPPSAGRSRTRRRSTGAPRGAAGVTSPLAGHAVRRRSPSGRTSSAASASRRRATRRSAGSPRCASAGRPTCSWWRTTCSSCARSSGSPVRAASRWTLLGRGSDLVISDAGIRGLVIHVRAEGSQVDGERLHRRGRRADGPRRDRDPEGRPHRARVRARRSRARSAARCGRTPARTTPTSRAILESATVLLGDGSEATLDAAGPRARLSRQPVQARAPDAELDPEATFRLSRRSRDDQGDASTTSAAGARRISRWACRRPAASSATRSGTRRAADRRGGAQGHAHRRRRRLAKHANFIVNDRKGTAADVRRLGEHVRATIRSGTAGPRFEIVFLGDWSGWQDRASSTWSGTHDRRPRAARPGHEAAARRSSSSSAVRPRSTTCRSSPAPPSPRRCAARATPWSSGWWTSTVGGGRCRRTTIVMAARARHTTSRSPGCGRPDRPGAARSTRSPRATRSPSCSSPSTGRSARTARSRRSSRPPSCAYTGSGVDGQRDRHGQGDVQAARPRARAAGRRLARGPRRALGAGPGRRAGRARGVRPGHRRSAPDGQARAARQLGRDDARPRARRARRRPGPRVPLRRRGDGRALPRRRPGPRGERHRQRARPSRAVRPGRGPRGPRVLRLRREVHARAVRDDDDRRGHAGAQRRPILKLARDTYRAVGCEGFARVDLLLAGDELVVSEINTIPGFTPISLFPTMPAAGGYDFVAVCRRLIDLALERHVARTVTGRAPPTCTGRRDALRRDRPRPVVRGAGPIRGAQGPKSPRPTAVRPRTRIGGRVAGRRGSGGPRRG